MCWPWMIEGMRDVVEVVMSLGVLEARVMIAKARTENIMKGFILMVLMLSWGVPWLFLVACRIVV